MCLGVAAGLIVLGESTAIVLGSPRLATATVVLVGIVFAVIAWYRLPLAILGTVVALPLVTVEVGFGDLERTVSTDKVALAALTTIWLVRYAPRDGRVLLEGAVAKWWLAFLGVVGLSAVANGASFGQAWGALAQVVFASVFFMTLRGLSVPETRVTVIAAALTASVVGLVALVEWAAWKAWKPVTFYFKYGTQADDLAGSTIAHTNFLGGYLVLLLPTLVVLLATGGTRARRAAALAAAAATGGLLYAHSVGAWIGVVAASSVLVGIAGRQWPSRRRWAGLSVVLVLVLVALGVELIKVRSGAVSVGVRAATYRIGVAAIGERPLLGHGANGYTHQSLRLEQAIYGRVLSEFHPASAPLSAHSSFVNVAVERGVPGLLAFVGLLAALLVTGLRGYGRAPDSTRLMIPGIAAGLVGFSVQALTENLFNYSKVAAIFWILAAALVRLALDDGRIRSGIDGDHAGHSLREAPFHRVDLGEPGR